MIPQNYRPFGGGATETVLHPLALAILAIAVLLMWFLPRKYMVMPFLAIATLVPLEQQAIVGGLHFMILRIILLCAWMRLLVGMGGGMRFLPSGLTTFDKVFMAWVVSCVITYTILWADTAALIYKLGFLYNAFGIYFLFRHVVRTRQDVVRLVRTLAIICAVIGVLMSIEQVTGQNALSIFGLPVQSEIRAGRIRSQGPFLHSIIAGTTGAILIPVFVGLWQSSRKSRVYAVIGVIAATLMTITSASTTPVAAYLAGVGAICMWPLRRHMRQIRWAVAGLLLGLHLVMKAPVWALIGRLNLVGGSTSWHRFALLDNFISRFTEWWLVGTRDSPKWGYDMWDSVNWYVASGISGGLIGLVLFVAIIAVSFRSVGRHIRSKNSESGARRFAWCLGAALFAAAISFIGIALFDQSIVLWYAVLAMIVTSTATVRAAEPQPAVVGVQSPGPNSLGSGSFPSKPASQLS
jgi:hypothetical protein